MPVFLISCLSHKPCLPPHRGISNRNQRTGWRQYYTQFARGLVKKMGPHLQPYGIPEFLGATQNGNTKSYLGNKACVTRNRPASKYILVYVHSGRNCMSLSRVLGGQQRASIFFTIKKKKKVSTSPRTDNILFLVWSFQVFSNPVTNLYFYIHILKYCQSLWRSKCSFQDHFDHEFWLQRSHFYI